MNLVATASALLLAAAGLASARDHLDLNGSWKFQLDPEGTGLARKWFAPGSQFGSSIQVPGAWQAQGFGKPSGILRNDYAGAAWYQRAVVVPAAWRDSKVTLHIGGAHRRTTVFVNGVELGGHDGFSAPFGFDVTSAIRPGEENVVVLRIENPAVNIEASPDKQDPVQPTGMLNYIANWGGIYGDVRLESAPKSRIRSVLVLSHVQRGEATFRVEVDNEGGTRPTSVRVSLAGAEPVAAAIAGEHTDVTVRVPADRVWTPDNPQLLTAKISLLAGAKEIDQLDQRFGFREVSTNGRVLLLNGKPLYLRGYGDDNVEVLTGFPPASKAVFLERLKRAKSFGFNAVRFHSMTPPARYFEAADEVGMFVMAELPAAYTQYFFAHRDFLRRELASVLSAHRNHPSLLSLAFGNEFNLQWLKTDADRKEFLASIEEFYRAAKQMAPGTLIMSNDGFDMRPTDMVSLYRGAPTDRPTVRHEFGQYYCSLPDPALIDKFNGVVVPEWLHAKAKWVRENGLTHIYPTYVTNSQKLQHLGRKYQIERVRLDERVSGYHYWLIVDYPGGTGEGDSWEEGWFDYFWQPKGIQPEQGRQLNSQVLLMIDAGVDQRTLWAGESKRIGVRLSNYGPEAIRNGKISWTLADGKTTIASGAITAANVDTGAVARVGEIELSPGAAPASRKFQLSLTLQTASGTYENRWDFWSYARRAARKPEIPVVSTVRLAALRRAFPWLGTDPVNLTPQSLLVTDVLDRTAMEHLRSGGRVWLMLRQTGQMRGIDFFPASGGALGTIVRDHPALAGTPHEGFCDLQFYNLLQGAYPLPIDGWPGETVPIIAGIRTTSEFLSKTKDLSRVAYAVDGKAGKGKLLITTLRLRENFDDEYPEAVSILSGMLEYASGDNFNPSVTIPERALERLGGE